MRPKTIAAALAAAFLLLAPAASQAFSLGELFGSRVDKALVAQVPQDQRGEMDKADFELAVANEEVALAKLKEDLADKQNDHAALGTKLAKAQARAAELALDTARIDAVDAAKLGKKEDNQKLQAELRADRTKNETERIQLKAKMDQTDVYVRDLKARVADKEQTVAGLKARRAAAAAPVPAPVAAPAPALKADEPLEIINKQPEVPAAPAPAPTPEADLKS
ncbi:MAG: hypothetical protein KKA55_13465 [Proteobacteria bacterium]|nr:hypothetical protein [Pseudomonadota bacterium]MBU1596527.1 hypothetical protein [Pseudomonadota bacterium]